MSSPFIRVNRAALHALIEQASDVIDAAEVEIDIGLPIPRNDLEALWRQAGVACLIGLVIYEDAEQFIEHKVYGENGAGYRNG